MFACAGLGAEGDEVSLSPAVVSCGAGGGVIRTIRFADYGVPRGSCGGFAPGNCSAARQAAPKPPPSLRAVRTRVRTDSLLFAPDDAGRQHGSGRASVHRRGC